MSICSGYGVYKWTPPIPDPSLRLNIVSLSDLRFFLNAMESLIYCSQSNDYIIDCWHSSRALTPRSDRKCEPIFSQQRQRIVWKVKTICGLQSARISHQFVSTSHSRTVRWNVRQKTWHKCTVNPVLRSLLAHLHLTWSISSSPAPSLASHTLYSSLSPEYLLLSLSLSQRLSQALC